MHDKNSFQLFILCVCKYRIIYMYVCIVCTLLCLRVSDELLRLTNITLKVSL